MQLPELAGRMSPWRVMLRILTLSVRSAADRVWCPKVPHRSRSAKCALPRPKLLNSPHKLSVYVIGSSFGGLMLQRTGWCSIIQSLKQGKTYLQRRVQLKKMGDLILKSILRELKFSHFECQRKGGWVRQEVGTRHCPKREPRKSLEFLNPFVSGPSIDHHIWVQFWRLLYLVQISPPILTKGCLSLKQNSSSWLAFCGRG